MDWHCLGPVARLSYQVMISPLLQVVAFKKVALVFKI